MVESDLSATGERKKVEKSSRISHNGESESCSILLHAYGQMHAKLFFQPYGSDHDRRPRPMPFRRNCSQVARVFEKRRDYLVELHMSGQWSDHFEEQKFKRYVREAADAVERWAAVVPPPRTETKPRPATTLPTPGRRGIA